MSLRALTMSMAVLASSSWANLNIQSFDSLKTAIDNKQVQSIEEVIENLSDEMKENYVLMYHSRSLQEATPNMPRAILRSKNGEFLLSFNGSEEQKGFDSLEVIQYRQKDKRFDFHEIIYDASAENVLDVSEKDPQKCASCHQAASRMEVDMRPNWEPYNTWPGAYRGVDRSGMSKRISYGEEAQGYKDFKKKMDMVKSLKITERNEVLKRFLNEFNNYIEFLKHAKTHDRYKHLKKLDKYIRDDQPIQMSAALAPHHYERVVRILRRTPYYGLLKEATYYALVCKTKEGHHLGIFPEDFAKKLKDSLPENLFRKEFLSVAGNGSGEDRAADKSLSYLYDALGVDTTDWSSSFKYGGLFAFRSRFGTPANYKKTMADYLYRDDLALRKFLKSKMYLSKCDKLAQEAHDKVQNYLNAGNDFAFYAPPSQTGETPLVVRKCMRCHERGSKKAPVIKFEDKSFMKNFLIQEGGMDKIEMRVSSSAPDDIQMPPRQMLSPLERDTLFHYLRKMAQ